MYKRMNTTVLLTSILFLSFSFQAQEWVTKMLSNEATYEEIKESFDQYMETTTYERGKGIKQFWRWDYFVHSRLGGVDKTLPHDIIWKEWKKFESKYRLTSNERMGDWQPIGPTNVVNGGSGYAPGHGRINTITVREGNANEILIGTPNGGCWRTLDRGSTWENITDGYPLGGVSDILLDASNPNKIIIATGDKNVFDSYGSGLYVSNDNGLTWETMNLVWDTQSFINVRALVRSVANPTHLHVATNRGYYRSIDNGDSWDQLESGYFYDIQILGGLTERLIMSSYCTTIYSDDAGLTWTNSGGLTGGSSNCSRTELATTPDNPNLVLAISAASNGGFLRGIYKSVDRGESFTLLYDDLNILGINNNGTSATGQGWFDLDIAIAPGNEDEIYVAGINLWKSIDGGLTFGPETIWTFPNNLGYIHPDVHYLEMIDDTLMYIATDGGLYETPDSAGTFYELTNGMQISQYYGFDVATWDEGHILGGTQDNGSIYIRNGLEEHVLGGDGTEARFHPTDPDTMFVCFQRGGLRRSLNGGASFQTANLPSAESAQWVMPYFFDYNNTSHLYAGRVNVWKTIDVAENWSNISLGQIGTAVIDEMTIHPSNSMRLALSKGNDFYYTENNGNTWNPVLNISDQNISGIAYDPVNPWIYVTLTGYTAGEKVLVSKDGGNTWENVSKNLPNVPVSCIVFDKQANNGIYIGGDFGVWYTNDNLTNWVPFNDNLPMVPVFEIIVHQTTGNVFAATYGRGIYKSNPIQVNNVAPIADFETREPAVCVGEEFKPIDYSLYAETVLWSVPNSVEITSTEVQPTFTFNTPGLYPVTLTVTNQNGSDIITKTDFVRVYENWNIDGFKQYDFEDELTLTETDFYEVTANSNVHYVITDVAGSQSAKCIKLNSSEALSDEVFELVGPNINFAAAASGTKISFDYAFRNKSDNISSRLRLRASKNCGETWTTIASLSLNTLESGEDLLGEFIPDASEWITRETNILSSFFEEDFQFKFEFDNRGGNDLYLDNINIDFVANLDQLEASDISIFPNPTTNYIRLSGGDFERVEVLNLNGAIVATSFEPLNIDVRYLSSGVYLIKAYSQNRPTLTTKFVKE